MEIFATSRLSCHGKREIVEEIPGVSRGQLFQVSDGKESWALRMYQAESQMSHEGLSPAVLKSTAALTLQHPHVLRLVDLELVESTSTFLFLFELAEGNLTQWLKLYRLQTTPPEVTRLSFQIAQGLHYLHEHHFVHRRLNASNIMMVKQLNETMDAKIGDFYDLSVYYLHAGRQGVIPVSVASYTAPEILAGTANFSPAADIWSLGVILYEIIFGAGQYPFGDGNKDKVLAQIYQVLGTPCVAWRKKYADGGIECRQKPSVGVGFAFPGQEGLDELLDLIKQCLVLDPEKRIKMPQVLGHPAFRGLLCPAPTEVKHPRVPRLKSKPLQKLRQEWIASCREDLRVGLMLRDPFLMAIDLFDRTVGEIIQIQEEMYNLFSACYLLGLKLLTNTDRPIEESRGIVLINDRNCRRVLELERMVCNVVQFKFFADELVGISVSHSGFWRKLAQRPLFASI